MESGRWGNRDGGEKSGEIRDERALHILLYLSKQLASQPKVSSSLSLSLSFFLSPPLCQTDDRMWREGLERRDSWRWKDNGFWNAIALLTFGDFGVLCWCVCLWNPSHSRISYGHSTRPHWLSLKHSSEFQHAGWWFTSPTLQDRGREIWEYLSIMPTQKTTTI